MALVGFVPLSASANHAPPPESHEPAGSGRVEGHEAIEEQDGFPCFRATRTVFALRGDGTYHGRSPGGPVVFRAELGAGQTPYEDGPLQIEAKNTVAYYHGPLGTHGTDTDGGAGCNAATTGAQIPAQFKIFAADQAQDTNGDSEIDLLSGQAWVYRLNASNQKIPCIGVGWFSRWGGDWTAEWTLSEDCVVVGNAAGTPGTGTAPRGTLHTHHGDHDPCFNWPCANNLRLDYAQYLPVPGPLLTLSGPDSAATNCDRPVTVTARLTVTGWPQPDVPVTFSVAGPAPATPFAGAGVTDANGRAGFSFTAARPGAYTVTAAATYQGEQRSATKTVMFAERPALAVALTGLATGQTEEPTTVNATVNDPCGPHPGAAVHFEVAAADPPAPPWRLAGEATPTAGDAVTDPFGRASFAFSGNRAGDYDVVASSVGASATATHTVTLAINTLKATGALTLPSEEKGLDAALMDPSGRYAYFLNAQGLTKVDLATLQRVGRLDLIGANAGVVEPAGRYAFVAAAAGGSGVEVVKVDLATLQRAGAIPLEEGDDSFSAAVIDPTGTFAYFGNEDGIAQSRVVKVDLHSLQRVASFTLTSEDRQDVRAAVMDPAGRFAYFVTHGSAGRVVKVDLATFQPVATIVLDTEESSPSAAVIDPAGEYAYVGTTSHDPGRVVKIDLRTFRRVGAIVLTPSSWYPVGTLKYRTALWEGYIHSGVMDPGGDYAYFVMQDPVPTVLKVDLRTFQRVHHIAFPDTANELRSAVIDPTGGHAYFGTHNGPDSTQQYPPEKVIEVQLKRPPNPALTAGADAYITEYETPVTVPAPGVLADDADADGDPLVALGAGDPAGGSVVVSSDGSFTYTPDAGFAGTDTFTYTASDGVDYSAPATVSITVKPPSGLTGTANGYASSVSLFGGPSEPRGPAPAVALSPDGSNSAQNAHVEAADATYGPAAIFESGPIDVHAEGALLPARYASTSVTVAGHTDPAQRPGPFLYDRVAATCSATTAGASTKVTLTNAVVETKYDPDTQEAVESEPVPAEPPQGYTVEGTIDHVGDAFRIVFNERVTSAGGALAGVNAAHLYLLGPTAVGDVVIGRTVCGAPLHTGPNTAPVASDDAYTASAAAPLVVPARGLVGNDTDADADTLSAALASPPAHGSAVVGRDGSFTYTPNAGFAGTDSFTYTATDGFGGGDAGTVTLAVTAANTVSVGDVALSEGDSGTRAAVFSVTLARPSTSTVSFGYATTAATATAGADYTAKSGTVTFAPGTTAATVKVPVAGDVTDEADEVFTVVLSNPAGVVIGDGTGTGTIADDDPRTVTGPRLSVGDVSVHEGDAGARAAVFTVALSKASTSTVKVSYATANITAVKGVDYTRVTGTLSFAPGVTSITVKVPVVADTVAEADETFVLNLSAASGATTTDAAGVGTVLDDD